MFFLKKIACRTIQTGFRIALPFLPYREPKVISSCANLYGVLKKEKVRSVLIVTDAGIRAKGLTESLENTLRKAQVSYIIYDKTQPNPTVKNVEEALQLYRAHHCDSLIAIGGGSSMDCAKAVGARCAHPRCSLAQLKGILRVWRRLPLLIAIPTTAGTGSEVTLAAVITDSDTHHKYALMSFPLIPRYAVLDPRLTCSLPPQLTATTGMDALTHAVEAYIGRSTTKLTRQLAREAAQLVFANIKKAYQNGADLEAREHMLHAAYKAGVAFSQSYVGYVHAVAHSLGGRYGIPHGLANAVLLPYVLDAYGSSAERKLHELGICVGVASEQDAHKAGAEKFIAAIRKLNADMNIPDKISGIRREDIDEMAGHAEREANPLYPVPKLMTRNELKCFYEKIADWKEA